MVNTSSSPASTGLATIEPAYRRAIGTACKVGESPLWDTATDSLYWADVRGPALYRYETATHAVRTWPLKEPIGAFAIGASGSVIAALRSGVYRLDVTLGAAVLIARPEPERHWNRPNDGKVSPCGNFLVFGSMHDRVPREPTGALYSLDPSGRCRRIADGCHVNNGLAWSRDGRTLYQSDSHLGVIFAWDWDADAGTVHRRRVFATADEAQGRPDGAAVDVEDCYWSAGVSAGVLHRYAPNGERLLRMAVPVRNPTMPAFGGAGLDLMYLTSLVRPGEEPGALDGRVLEYASPVRGTAPPRLKWG